MLNMRADHKLRSTSLMGGDRLNLCTCNLLSSGKLRHIRVLSEEADSCRAGVSDTRSSVTRSPKHKFIQDVTHQCRGTKCKSKYDVTHTSAEEPRSVKDCADE
eukprot:1159127-Pelagomonas_calceolata.AAC.4